MSIAPPMGDPVWILPDGAGTITDMSIYGQNQPSGSYNVSPAGVLNASLLAGGSFTGQFVSSTHVVLTSVSGDCYKVQDTGLCQGNWSGTLTEDVTSTVYPISFTVDGAGQAYSIVGFATPASGRFYALPDGTVVGFIRTAEAGDYHSFRINGNLISDTITGTYDTEIPTGVVTLAR